MDEIDIQKQSFSIQEIADNLIVCDDETLKTTLEIIKAIRKHKQIIIEYWKNAKESAKKAYQEISKKEKEMLDLCENNEKILKDRILNYTKLQEKRKQQLIIKAESDRKIQIEKLLSEAANLEENGDLEESKNKINQAEKLENINLSLVSNLKDNKITIQKRFKCRITNNKLVPAFFNSIEIREINTKKLLEIRKIAPDAKIPGVIFYQDENLIIRSV